MNDAPDSDILADYREWRSQQDERIGTHSDRCHLRLAAEIGTHSDRCHLWPRHERCMIHRLAAEIGRLRKAIRRLAEQDATLSVCDGNVTVTVDATLTDAERRAIADAADRYAEITPESAETAATLRGLLERLGGGA